MWFSMVFAIAAIAAIGYAFFLAPEAWRQPLAGTALLAVLAAGTAGIYSSIQGVRRAGRERDRGYTTTYGDHRQLWQLDPGTGEVLRRPGEPKVRRGPR
jgi:hypothetical protein